MNLMLSLSRILTIIHRLSHSNDDLSAMIAEEFHIEIQVYLI